MSDSKVTTVETAAQMVRQMLDLGMVVVPEKSKQCMCGDGGKIFLQHPKLHKLQCTIHFHPTGDDPERLLPADLMELLGWEVVPMEEKAKRMSAYLKLAALELRLAALQAYGLGGLGMGGYGMPFSSGRSPFGDLHDFGSDELDLDDDLSL